MKKLKKIKDAAMCPRCKSEDWSIIETGEFDGSFLDAYAECNECNCNFIISYTATSSEEREDE